jgi:hypothetical protein
MKPSRLFWGTLFVIFGALLLLGRNVHLDLGFDFIWRFWPVAFILIGLAVIFKDPKVKGILAALAAIGLALFLYGLVSFEWLDPIRLEVGDGDEREERGVQVQEFSEPLVYDLVGASSVKHASLKLEAAAGKYVVDTSEGELLHGKIRTSIGKFVLDRESTNNDVRLHLKPEHKSIHIGSFRNIVNEAEVRLSTQTLWDIDFDIGAARMDCDLSSVQVQNIDINAGAASLKLKLGVPARRVESSTDEMRVKIDAGASTVRISVPESVGCEVRIDGGLSSKKLVDFEKIRDGLYQTASFAQEPKRIYIDVDAGVSNIRVVRY